MGAVNSENLDALSDKKCGKKISVQFLDLLKHHPSDPYNRTERNGTDRLARPHPFGVPWIDRPGTVLVRYASPVLPCAGLRCRAAWLPAMSKRSLRAEDAIVLYLSPFGNRASRRDARLNTGTWKLILETRRHLGLALRSRSRSDHQHHHEYCCRRTFLY